METNKVNQWYWMPIDYQGPAHFAILDIECGIIAHPSPMGQENACLIAAAPMMLDALRRLIHPMADDTDMQNALDVIARATGAP